MDPTTSAAAYSRSGDDPYRISRKRNRPVVSCNHCRFRKLKCSRTKPCEACVKAGDSKTCSYMPSSPREVDRVHSSHTTRDNLSARVDRLEQLLLSTVVDSTQDPVSPAINVPSPAATPENGSAESIPKERLHGEHEMEKGSDVDRLSHALGVMKVDLCGNTTWYLGSAHWVSIMCEIEEFRTFLETNHEDLERGARISKDFASQINGCRPSLLRGTAAPISRDELISQLPCRAIADKLVMRFFTFQKDSAHIVHEPLFMREYNLHWKYPQKTKIIWLGLLFVMLHHAEISYEVADENSAAEQESVLESTSAYKTQVIQCLIASDYTKPVAYTLETLLLYIGAEWITSQDTLIDISLILGMVVRLAMRMGIHRDSKSHSGITPFQGEMRRRIWATIHKMDILCCIQSSLPTTVRQSDCDSRMPSNLYSVEFDEDTKDLPPSRPLSEITEVSYSIIKYRSVLLLEQIMSFAELVQNKISHDDIRKYEQALQEIYEMTPPPFRMQGESTNDSVSLKRQRINLDRIYQLGKCVLYRKFLSHARHDATCLQYRGACVDAAMTLLNHQATMYLDCGPNYLRNVKKRHLTSLTTHDFFIAVMAVAIDLHYGFKSEPSSQGLNDVALWGYDRRSEMIKALEISNEFWRICKNDSVEAAKAYGMFSFVLVRAKRAQRAIEEQVGISLNGFDSVVGVQETPLNGNDLDMNWADIQIEFDTNLWNAYGGDGGIFGSFIPSLPINSDSLNSSDTVTRS